MEIALNGISKQFGRFAALRGVDLTIRSGELLALLGPSGSGKTTLLRIIAGLAFPEAGRLTFDGVDATHIPARDRQVGFVFQHYALFRHMTVAENVGFGLSVRRKDRPSAAKIRDRALELLRLVKIEELAERYPTQLSGGQRQRVALARALAIEPRVLLLDEPFGALDAKVRKDLRRWIRHLHDEINVTSVFVTHDQDEALEVADRVVIMNNGQIEQIGTPSEVYDAPVNSFVFGFLGDANRIPYALSGGVIDTPGIKLALPVEHAPRDGVALVRPHDIQITPDSSGLCRIRRVSVIGATAHLEVSVDQGNVPALEIVLPQHRFAELGLQVGSKVALHADRGTIVSAKDAHLAA